MNEDLILIRRRGRGTRSYIKILLRLEGEESKRKGS